MKKLLFTLLIIPSIIWSQDTNKTVTSGSGVDVNILEQLDRNVSVDTVLYTGKLNDKGIVNLGDALREIDRFDFSTGGGSGFDSDATFVSNNATYTWNRANPGNGNPERFFEIDPSTNFIRVVGDYAMGNYSSAPSSHRVYVGYSSSARASLGIRQSTGNVNEYWGVGTNSAADNVAEMKANGDIELKVVGAGVIIASPNGTRWRLTPSDAGTSAWTQLP